MAASVNFLPGIATIENTEGYTLAWTPELDAVIDWSLKTTTFPVDATEVHTYQILDDGSEVALYVDREFAFPMTAGGVFDNVSGFFVSMRGGMTLADQNSFWSVWQLDDTNTVPEPATMALLVVGGLTVVRRRR